MNTRLQYFAQYPALALNWYPPFFPVVESVFFAVFGIIGIQRPPHGPGICSGWRNGVVCLGPADLGARSRNTVLPALSFGPRGTRLDPFRHAGSPGDSDDHRFSPGI